MIAIAFIGQANQLGDTLYLFALALLPPVLLTAASMVACISAIVGGVTVALAVRALLDASVLVAAVTGAVVAVTFASLFLGYQIRRVRRAAAVVPELYEGQSPDMPGWTKRVDRQKR